MKCPETGEGASGQGGHQTQTNTFFISQEKTVGKNEYITVFAI